MGPTGTVLLFAELGSAEWDDLVTWLQLFTRDLDGDVDFWIDDPAPIGAPELDPASACRFSLEYLSDKHPDWYAGDEEEYRLLPQRPAAGLGVGAGGNDPIDHRLLGHLLLTLARRYGGLVDFGGDLDHRHGATAISPEQVEYDRRFAERPLESLPGRLWNIGWHVGDADLLEAWLGHPNYHLIK
jgi:uncharacterized protein DUF6368